MIEQAGIEPDREEDRGRETLLECFQQHQLVIEVRGEDADRLDAHRAPSAARPQLAVAGIDLVGEPPQVVALAAVGGGLVVAVLRLVVLGRATLFRLGWRAAAFVRVGLEGFSVRPRVKEKPCTFGVSVSRSSARR